MSAISARAKFHDLTIVEDGEFTWVHDAARVFVFCYESAAPQCVVFPAFMRELRVWQERTAYLRHGGV